MKESEVDELTRMMEGLYDKGYDAGYKRACEEFIPLLKAANEKCQLSGHALLTLKEK